MNEQNRLDVYMVTADTLLLKERITLSIWNEEREISKAYTRLVQYDDSLFVGTSFMPRKVSVELLNMKSAQVVYANNPTEDKDILFRYSIPTE